MTLGTNARRSATESNRIPNATGERYTNGSGEHGLFNLTVRRRVPERAAGRPDLRPQPRQASAKL